MADSPQRRPELNLARYTDPIFRRLIREASRVQAKIDKVDNQINALRAQPNSSFRPSPQIKDLMDSRKKLVDEKHLVFMQMENEFADAVRQAISDRAIELEEADALGEWLILERYPVLKDLDVVTPLGTFKFGRPRTGENFFAPSVPPAIPPPGVPTPTPAVPAEPGPLPPLLPSDDWLDQPSYETASIGTNLRYALGVDLVGDEMLDAPISWGSQNAEVSGGARRLAIWEGRAEAAEELAELGAASEGLAKQLEEIEQKAPTAFDVAAAAALHFGEVGTGAFDVYADAMEESLSVQSLLSQKTGRAMQNALAATLRSVGREAAASAVMEAAKGTAAATGLFDDKKFGSATGHFAAAAMFGSVAGLAGIGSASVSVQPGGSHGSRESRAGGRGGIGDGARGIHVTVIGSLDDEARRQLAQRLAEEIAAH